MGSGARNPTSTPSGRSGAKRSSGTPGGDCAGGGCVGPDTLAAGRALTRRPQAVQARAALCLLKLVLPLHNKVCLQTEVGTNLHILMDNCLYPLPKVDWGGDQQTLNLVKDQDAMEKLKGTTNLLISKPLLNALILIDWAVE